MQLFHGSNVEVVAPEIRTKLRALDFGSGFYVTSSQEQVRSWAKAVVRRRKTGVATLSTYSFDLEKIENLKILAFEKADIA